MVKYLTTHQLKAAAHLSVFGGTFDSSGAAAVINTSREPSATQVLAITPVYFNTCSCPSSDTDLRYRLGLIGGRPLIPSLEALSSPPDTFCGP